jgi:IclR family mhp operon transcriptional activator
MPRLTAVQAGCSVLVPYNQVYASFAVNKTKAEGIFRSAMKDYDKVKSAVKVLSALTFFNANRESTVTDVARGIGVPRTTAYRLLQTLCSEGYLKKLPQSDLYRMTSLVQHLSSGFSDLDMIVEVAHPLIDSLGLEISWPLALATPRGENMVVRLNTDYNPSLAIERFSIGCSMSILHSPAGLCYLAFSDEATVRAITSVSGPSMDNVYSGPHLQYYLQQIRQRGYCHISPTECPEERLAVPLVVNGKVIGCIMMRCMKGLVSEDEIKQKYAHALQKLAADIAAHYDRRVNEGVLAPRADSAFQASLPELRRASST